MGILAQIQWFGQHAPLAVALFVVIALLAWRLYRPQVHGVDSRWRWVLPALRLVAVAALIISILRPVLIRPRTDGERGAIVILVDRSRSMSVHDSRRSGSDLLRLAEGLGLLPTLNRGETMTHLQTELTRLGEMVDDVLRVQTELDYAILAAQGRIAATARMEQTVAQFRGSCAVIAQRAAEVSQPLADALGAIASLSDPLDGQGRPRESSQRDVWAAEARSRIERAVEIARKQDEQLLLRDPEVRSVCDELAKLSRFELVQLALVGPGSGLLSKLPEGIPLFGFAFANATEPLPLVRGRERVKRLTTAPDAPGTDINSAIADAIAKLHGQDVHAIVVLSDGRQVGADASAASSGWGVPVFAVAASDSSTPDISILSVSAPSRVTEGQSVTVLARLRVAGFRSGVSAPATRSSSQPATTLTARLRIGEQEIIKPVAFTDKGPTVEFSIRMTGVGPQQIVLSIDPLSGEASTQNNRVERTIEVHPARADAPGAPAASARFNAAETDESQAAAEREMANLSGDYRFLRNLAQVSGGEFLTLDQVSYLPQKLLQAGTAQSRTITYPLWDSSLLYVFVLCCFSAEWALRKIFGLA